MSGKKQPAAKITAANLIALTGQASQGDRAAMLRLRRLMGDNRDRLRKLLAGRCRTARGIHTATDLYGKVQSLAINAHVDLLGSELTSDGSSRVEQLLIDRVVICWLTLHTLEHEAAREFRRSPGKPSTLEKERDHAHRRYVRALHELARLRRAGRLDEICEAADARDDSELTGEDCAERG